LLLILSPLAAHAGGLAYLATSTVSDTLDEPESIAVSPDDDCVYTGSRRPPGLLSVWIRDPGTGVLTEEETDNEGDVIPGGTVDGIADARFVAVAAAMGGGTHLYVASRQDSAVGVFKSASDTVGPGACALSFIQAMRSGDPNGPPPAYPGDLKGASAAAVSPTGDHVYVAATSVDSVVVFQRDAGTGKLTWVETDTNGTGEFLNNPLAIAVSPDGLFVYAAAQIDPLNNTAGSVVVFGRDLTTGKLTWIQSVRNNDPTVTPLVQRMEDPKALAVSADGKHLYVASTGSDAVVVFSRDPGPGPTTGFLTFVEFQHEGGAVKGLINPRAIGVSADGGYVFATGALDDGLVVFSRDVSTGKLLPLQTFLNPKKAPSDPALLHGMMRPLGVALAPNTRHLYVAANQGHPGGVVTFANDTCGDGNRGADEECDGGVNCTAGCKLDVCGATPKPCQTPSEAAQASLLIKNDPTKPDSKDQLQWKWKKGAADIGDYGNPTATADYVLCIYDKSTLPYHLLASRVAPSGGSCDKGKPCWKATISGNPAVTTKYSYKDGAHTPDGVSQVSLKPGPTGVAKITFQGKGFFLHPPGLGLTGPVTVQAVNTETLFCWGSTFTNSTSNGPAKYQATSD
jgi:6-phosphogluconolactonase (cycloisomerase 2 family)